MGWRRWVSWLYALGWKIRLLIDGPVRVLSKEPRLTYAGLCCRERVPSHGGNVKLLTLNTAFPEQKRASNLLYLVSSGVSLRSRVWADVSLQRGIKLVWNQNGVAYPAWSPRDYKRLNGRMSMLLHRASFVVYQSRFCQEMSDRFLGRFAGPSAVVYNAVDTAMFSPAGRKPAANGAPLRLLAMGSHEDPVRVMAALDVVAALAAQGVSAVLTVAGRLAWPGADNDVKAAVALLGLQGAVTLRGPYTQREAGDILRSADILLHLKYADPCPTVVIEAMACGLPVVGSRSGGLPELVGDEAGALVPVPLDLEKLYVPPIADAVAAVRTVAASLEDFSSAARKRAVACFDKALWIEEHRRIFQQVLGS